jgi:hypothetical protein
VIATVPLVEVDDKPPEETLRTVRRGVVGRWWVQVRPLADGGFHALAHTMSGPPGVWAGPVRATLAAAVDDAVEVLGELRRHD